MRELTVSVQSISEAITFLDEEFEKLSSVDIVKLIVQPRRPRMVSVTFAVPTLINPKTGAQSAMSIAIPNDAIASIPIVVKDAVGKSHAPSATATVAVADPTVASAALSADGNAVVITPLKLTGGSSVTYTDADDNLTATEDFTIIAPAATSATFNEAGVTLTANPTPPTA